CQQYISAPYSF
nr:immunoglobulin light chain junction region [Macaca mulatta]